MTSLTLGRMDLLAEIATVADEARELEQTDRLNIFHGLARMVAANGSKREERIALAAYALAIAEDDETDQ